MNTSTFEPEMTNPSVDPYYRGDMFRKKRASGSAKNDPFKEFLSEFDQPQLGVAGDMSQGHIRNTMEGMPNDFQSHYHHQMMHNPMSSNSNSFMLQPNFVPPLQQSHNNFYPNGFPPPNGFSPSNTFPPTYHNMVTPHQQHHQKNHSNKKQETVRTDVEFDIPDTTDSKNKEQQFVLDIGAQQHALSSINKMYTRLDSMREELDQLVVFLGGKLKSQKVNTGEK